MSYEFICFHTSISHLARRYAMVSSLSFLSRSSYGIPLTLSTISVALIWTFSIACNYLLSMKPPQTATPNSGCRRTKALFNGITISAVQQVKLLLMMTSIWFASICDSKASSESMIIPRCFSSRICSRRVDRSSYGYALIMHHHKFMNFCVIIYMTTETHDNFAKYF